MNQKIDGEKIRNTLLEVIVEYSKKGPGYFQVKPILHETVTRLGLRRSEDGELAIITLWHDLYRSGHISWGLNIDNPDLPSVHLTERGRKALEHFSRDPVNPSGYLTYLKSTKGLNPIAESYITESLQTYNANCFKATAVMVGGAAESIVLAIRDSLVNRLNSLGKQVPADLLDWKIKRVIDSISNIIDNQIRNIPEPLKSTYESYWQAFVQQIRATRNDVGHPHSIDPITPENVHAALLIFPELAKLGTELQKWITSSLT